MIRERWGYKSPHALVASEAMRKEYGFAISINPYVVALRDASVAWSASCVSHSSTIFDDGSLVSHHADFAESMQEIQAVSHKAILVLFWTLAHGRRLSNKQQSGHD
jgi:hypothetical protein